MSEPVLDVRDLSISYFTAAGEVRAVRGASLSIAPGETVALVGESGSGKSSLAYGIVRWLDAGGRVVSGTVSLHGQNLVTLPARELRAIRGSRIAMVFQDPQTALNPALRVGPQVAEVLREHEGLSRAEARRRAIDGLAQVNLPDPAGVYDRYPHELSGGQQQRVLIAMAFACTPELLLMDEPTTGLDVTTEARILDLVEELKARHGSAILYITHNLGVVARFCHRVVVMYAGEVVEEGPVARVFARPAHPYTRGLLSCVPRLDWSKHDGPLSAIDGRLPSAIAPPRGVPTPPGGCVFEPRCAFRVAECRETTPPATALPDGGFVRCLRSDQLPPFAFGPAGATSTHAELAPAPDLLSVDALRCEYPRRRGLADVLRNSHPPPIRAVDGVTLGVAAGRTLSVVGESGCGKTTLGRAVVGLLEPAAGTIVFDGRDVTGLARARPRELRRRAQIVFQNPDATLNPQKRVEATLRRPLELFGIAAGAERERRVSELLAAVQLPDAYRTRYPHELSGGEKQRVAIARAFAAEPDLIVCDEPLSALDVSVQAAILNLLVDLQRRSQTSYLFISHDLSVVRFLSDRVAVMYLGKLCEVGTAEEVFTPPYHPYTEALLSAIPVPDPAVRQRRVRLEGTVPSAVDPPSGCPFHTRCPRKLGVLCEREEPPARAVSPGHVIHCHIPLDDLHRVAPVVEHAGAER